MSKSESPYRITLAEAAPFGQLQRSEIEARWSVRPRWDGAPSVTPAAAAEIHAEDQRRADLDAKIRSKWAAWSADHQRRRSQAFQAGANGVTSAAGASEPEQYAIRQQAGSAALREYDRRHPFPGEPGGPADMYEWARQQGIE